MVFQTQATILLNDEIAPGYYRMKFISPEIAGSAQPGQFVHVRCGDSFEPLLRRPLSISGFDRRGGVLEIIYQVVGQGTSVLSKTPLGGTLDITGPHGNGFLTRELREEVILVGGGVGVASLFALAEELASLDPLRVRVLVGAKTKERLLCARELTALGIEVMTATEDGTNGFCGLVTELLRTTLEGTRRGKHSTLYACGSRAMLECVARIAEERGVECWVSMEERMGCAMGVCLGCAVKTIDGFKQACVDGPIFRSSEVVWSS